MTTFGTILLVFVVPVSYIIGLVIGVAIGRYERKQGRHNG